MSIIVHACGGTGINLSNAALHSVADLGDGFANIEFNYLDTSRANIDKIQTRGNFWQVTKHQLTTAEIQGGGGEKKTIFKDVLQFVPKYLDEKKIHKRVTGEYHIVAASASGASGSIISSALIQHLLAIDIPVVAIIVGDSSNALYTTNTLNTLATLNNMALKAKKPLSIIYANNYSFGGGASGNSGEKAVNDRIRNIVSALSLFLSGKNQELDQKDLEGFIDQSMYSTITVPPGLYGLSVFSKSVNVPEGAVATLVRTLTTRESEATIGIPLLHHKVGYVTEDNALTVFGEQFPLHLVTYSNFFARESAALKEADEKFKEMQAAIQNHAVAGSSNATEDEDSGFIL